MSTLKVNTIQNTGGGSSSTPDQIDKGRAKLWVSFDGTFGTSPFTTSNGGIRSSFNVSSITDNGTGDYTVNFSITFANTNYVATFMERHNNRTMGPSAYASLTTTDIDIAVYNGVGNLQDRDILGMVIFGDVNT